MKSKFLIVLAACLFCGISLNAQVYMEDQEKDKKQDQQEPMQSDQLKQDEMKRRQMIANVMNLEQDEDEEFWNVYDDYRQEIGDLQEKEIQLMNNYAESYGHLNDEQADQMVKELLDLEKEEAKIKKDYRSKFENVVPATKVARFYQADNKIDLAMKYKAARQIPIVDMEDEMEQDQQRDRYQQNQNDYERQRQQQQQYEKDLENQDYEDQ